MCIRDSTCGHCKKETPKLVDFYNKYKDTFNLQVFAVCTDSSFNEMKKAIKTYNMYDFINVNGIYTCLLYTSYLKVSLFLDALANTLSISLIILSGCCTITLLK